MPVGAAACAGAPCVVAVYKKGSGAGLVTSTPAGIACGDVCWMTTEFDERVTLTPTPSQGSVFTGWTGECASVDATKRCHLLMDISKAVTAVFDLEGAPPTPLVDVFVPPPPKQPEPFVPPPPGCTIGGTPGDDLLYGTPGDDVICSLAGDDHVHGGGGGDDVIRGGPGDDEIEGQTGDDRLFGGGGRDTIDGGPGADRLSGGPGADVLRGGAGRDVLLARDRYADRVAGGAGRDAARADARDRLRSIEKRL